MIESLKRAFDLAEQRSEHEQRALASLLLEEMQAEERWSALLTDPRSSALLDRLADEAVAEDVKDDTESINGEQFVRTRSAQNSFARCSMRSLQPSSKMPTMRTFDFGLIPIIPACTFIKSRHMLLCTASV